MAVIEHILGMTVIEHILGIPAEHYKDKKNIGTDDIELKYEPYGYDKAIIWLDIETKDGIKIESHIELGDAIALRDFLNTIIPTMEKQNK